MKLDEILELITKAKLRLESGQTLNYTLGAIDEAIDELKTYIEKQKIQCIELINIKEDLKEIVKVPKIILVKNNEKEFWLNCYIAALNCGYANTPQDVADMGVFEFRKRLEDE